MKYTLNLAIGLAGVLLAPSLHAALDGNLDITATPGTSSSSIGPVYQVGNGGEFLVTATPSAGSPNLGTFLTFCIELNEEISYGTGTYYYQINTGAVNGGNNAHATDTLAGPGLGHSMDNISIGTAWLYSQFRAGNLGANSAALAGGLQNAFWYLEGEIAQSDLSTYNGADGTALVAMAAAHTGTSTSIAEGSAGSIFNDSHGAYGVVALNLFTSSDPNTAGFAQDQLAIVPEPTTMIAGSLLLLPFAASAIRIVRRKRTAQPVVV